MVHFLVSVVSDVKKKQTWFPTITVREAYTFEVKSNSITVANCLQLAKSKGLINPEILGWTVIPISDHSTNAPTI